MDLKMLGMGIWVGLTVCSAYCGFIILPLVLSSRGGALRGFLMALIFSLGRMFSYAILGAAAGVGGIAIINLFQSDLWVISIHAFVGLLLGWVGAGMILGLRLGGRLCKMAARLGGGYCGLFTLGAITGIAPCAPLIAGLAFIAAGAPGLALGVRAGLMFGLGTALSPLLVAAALFGAGGRWAERSAKIWENLRLVAGYTLFIYGGHLLFSNLLAFVPL